MHLLKRIGHLCLLTLLLLTGACGRATLRVGGDLQTLASHTPGVAAGAQMVGPMNPEQQLELRVVLPLQNADALDAFLANLYDPQSASYGQYLTPDQFAATYEPDVAVVAHVRAALQQAGFTVEATNHGRYLAVHAAAADAEAFFHTQLDNYVAPDGNAFFAPSAAVAVDADLDIDAVVGLHTTFPATSSGAALTPIPHAASVSYFVGDQARSAYNVPSAYTGVGQVMGIFELDGYLASDIATYTQNSGLTPVPLKNILIGGFAGMPLNANSQAEVSADIELANAMAPGLQQIRVYEAPNSVTGWVDAWNEIANPTLDDRQLMPLISTSWGSAEAGFSLAEVTSENALFKQMAAQGQTVAAATGDFGAQPFGTFAIQDPSAQPYVLAVGGTTLTTPTTYTKEAAWPGSGGGISTLWPIPSWQTPLVNGASGASTTMRNVPDVALNSDPNTGYYVEINGGGYVYGGTSCASPLWVAFFALVNQARAQKAMAPLGFISPSLYMIGQSPAYTQNFHDMIGGNNNGFNAVQGLDNVTGLGSLNGTVLLQTLSTGYARSTFSAPVGLSPSP